MNTNDKEQYAFFREVGTICDKPLILYNIPSFVKSEISLNVVGKLLKDDMIAGLKETTSNVSRYRSLMEFKEIKEDFALYTGFPGLIDIALYLGFNGAVLGVSNIIPGLCKSVYTEWTSGNIDKAKESQRDIIKICNIISNINKKDVYSSIPATKLILKEMGIFETALQVEPYLPLQSDDTGLLLEVVRLISESESPNIKKCVCNCMN